MDVDIISALNNKPQEKDFIWSGFLIGTVGALIAPGGVGKSFFALEAAISVACTTDLLGLTPKKLGKVVYFATEDPIEIMNERLYYIGQHLDKKTHMELASNLTITSIPSKSLDLMNTAHIERLLVRCEKARLVILDTLSQSHNLDENSNKDMSKLIALLGHIARTTGASVLYLHHVNKGSAREFQTDRQQAARGASILIDNARWCAYLVEMSMSESKQLTDQKDISKQISSPRNDFVRFGVSKQSYSKITFEKWYKRDENGILLPINLKGVSYEEDKTRTKRTKAEGKSKIERNKF